MAQTVVKMILKEKVKNGKRIMAMAASIQLFLDKASILTLSKLTLNTENTGFNIVTDFHTQTTITGEININYIMDYIDQTEFTIINKRAFGNDTYFPSNSYICEKCKCVKKKPR